MCHHNTFLLYNSLERANLTRFKKATRWSVGVSIVSSAILGMAGFVAFGAQTNANILHNFCHVGSVDGVVLSVTRVWFALTMFCTYPLEAFVAREVVAELFFPDHAPSLLRHMLVTTALVLLSYVIAMLASDLSIILEITVRAG